VCVIPDLFFSVKVENLAHRHGLQVIYPHDREAFEAALPGAALVLIDSSARDVPWLDWVLAAKSDPATRSTPILAFGSHVDRALRDQALDAGVDRYLARENFVNALPEILARAARNITDDPCGEPLPEGARRGIEEFNNGQYFEQHETLELVWRAEDRAVRDLYRGILQIGVALLQVERGNGAGARKMFERGFRWLEPFRPACQGVDVERLVREAQAVYQEVDRLGPARIGEFDRRVFPRVHFTAE
jgi:CheY-like chemotaxis protein